MKETEGQCAPLAVRRTILSCVTDKELDPLSFQIVAYCGEPSELAARKGA